MSGPIRTTCTNKGSGKQVGRTGSITIAALLTLTGAVYTITDSDAIAGDVISVSPTGALEAGAIVAGAYCAVDGTVTIKIFNGSASTLTGGAQTFAYFICK